MNELVKVWINELMWNMSLMAKQVYNMNEWMIITWMNDEI